jgi:hypothetical protein
MEYLDGETLGACMGRQGPLALGEALELGREIAVGVGHAHRRGIVHRDLKPDNVFLLAPAATPGPRLKILDFGIAKLTAEPAGGGSRTRTGIIMGTPLYMAPEQCRGAGAVDHRVDIYALGCLIHLMITGEPPFPLEGVGEIIAAQLAEPPPPLRARAPGAPARLEALLLRMLAKAPEQRPATMEGVATELDQLLAGAADPKTLSAPAQLKPRVTSSSPAPAAGPTTFASAASIIGAADAPVPRRRMGWLALGAAVVVVAAAAIKLGAGHRPPEVASPAPPVAPVPAAVAPALAPASAPAPAPAKPATVTLGIESTPAGAEVVDGSGAVIGSTPFERRFPLGDGALEVSLEKEGFRPRRLTLGLDRDRHVSVKLERRARRPAAHPADEDEDRRKL